jgi:hypothetical protein
MMRLAVENRLDLTAAVAASSHLAKYPAKLPLPTRLSARSSVPTFIHRTPTAP